MKSSGTISKLSPAVVAVVAAVALAWSAFVLAATTTLSVALDTDNNAGTGCSIATVGGTLTGFEQILDTVVTTGVNTGQVGAITRRVCAGGVFGSSQPVSAGGWSVGLGTGDAGSDVIETFIPLADLGNASTVKLVAFTSADVLIGATTVNRCRTSSRPFPGCPSPRCRWPVWPD